MSRTCPVTGKTSQVGGVRKNNFRADFFLPCGKRRRHVNLQRKRIFIPELGIIKRLTLSTRAIKNINKNGAYSVLKKAGLL